MLRNILIIAIPAIVASLTVPTSRYCAKDCNCSEPSLAVCDTLNLEPFGRHIFSLKIVHPKVPLILKGQPFNVRGVENLHTISIENATILEIDKSAFIGVNLLSTLSIVNSNIPSINDPLAFAAATNLRILTITNSTLSKFELTKSRSLHELNLSGCKLTTVSKNSFTNLPYLSYLNLASNNISKVDPMAFSNLVYLQEIVLSNNDISNLHPSVFENNTELVTLDLSNNPLKEFDFNLVSDLEKLVLKSVNLEHLSEKMSMVLSGLSYLDLSNNKINFSRTVFDKMVELQYIDLSNNGLEHLDSHVFHSNSKLQKVILDNNNFGVMPKFVCGLDTFEIYYFSCNNCGLTSLPVHAFKHLPAIVILKLSHNRLDGNLTALQHLSSLIELDLSYNNIIVLNPTSFNKSSGLETLNLAGNPIINLDPYLFYNNRAIKSLDISFCNIQYLWKLPAKGKIPSLLQLNVANNSISSFGAMDLQIIPSLKVLDISNNPLQCDETLREAIKWLSEHDVSPAAATPTWKTHESANTPNGNKSMHSHKITSWKDLAREKCADDDFFLDEEKKEETLENVVPPTSIKNELDNTVDDTLQDEYDSEYNYFDEYDDLAKSDNWDDFFGHKEKENQMVDDEAEIDITELAAETTQIRSKHRSHYSFLWPTLVFIFTALSVLVIAANVMLLMIRSRMIPRHVNLPHIKIPQWSTNGKMKKHSGSVYQPLSEEKSEPCTPMISRKEHVPTHSMPKSIV